MQHFYKLYENNDELTRIAALFLQEGLDKGEFCFWAMPDNLKKKDALLYLRGYIELIDQYLKEDRIRLANSSEWYTATGHFDIDESLKKWDDLYKDSMSKGFSGLRVVGNATWVKPKDWKILVEYENRVNSIIKNYNFTALCAYHIRNLKSVVHISDIITNHEACFVSD